MCVIILASRGCNFKLNICLIMAADSVVIHGLTVLVVTEALNQPCLSVIESLKSRQCIVHVSGASLEKPVITDCKFIPSDLTTELGRKSLADTHFECFECVILICDDISWRISESASQIETLSNVSKIRHLGELFYAASKPRFLIYIKLITSEYVAFGDTTIFSRPCAPNKRIFEVFTRLTHSDTDYWTRIWTRIANGEFHFLDSDMLLNTPRGDSLSRSSSRRREKHPWTVQDCSFFP
eukprot:Gregarina_sp_Poly_1__8359@NODE_48_length_17742_cov_51_152532_g42_i0_p8_GENE_NODE_48_length_17742_cov_51_152532_g42_i0NODE_48_length_17742_cov_51_152532_g42_i0_p8_ORF_typecomplete_len239_score9_78TGBp3/PF02495_17/0_26_NODE_48_length_17742_cov_51_152532_g42_i052835999